MSKLIAQGITKAFGGITALDSAAVTVTPGRITGLIGRNGSGKSTLFNCVTGFLTCDAGFITVDGAEITGLQPHQIVRHGIVRSFQTPRVDAAITVREAVTCGLFPSVQTSFVANLIGTPGARREERAIQERADRTLEQFDLEPIADRPIGRLSMGLVRLVEVARGMVSGARYMLFDEPAAGLSREECDVLRVRIRQLAAEGVGLLIVEHNFPLIRSLCDTVTVLDFGRVIAEGPADEIASDSAVIDAYLGTAQEPKTETLP